MAKSGDYFIVVLKETHINWGTHRKTHTRDKRKGESYIPIPRKFARTIGIYNSHNGKGLGRNEYNATSKDGLFNGKVKCSGCSKKGDPYAKNLQGSEDLRSLGEWFKQVNIQAGDSIKVEWISSVDILLTKI